MQLIEERIRKAVAGNQLARKKLCEKSFAWFCFFYLPHYLRTYSADFQYEIYHLLENDENSFVEVIAFRGSAKSTIAALAYPLWCALYKKRNFIVLCSDTHTQAKLIIANIIAELENNALIIEDFGQMKTKTEEWQATNIILKNRVRIMSRSRGQKIRGLRHLEFRPDLIVCDDVENIEDVRSMEQRDKTEEWLLSDVVPTIDAEKGKLVVIGNMLHNDSLMARIRAKKDLLKGLVVREYPLIDAAGNCIWEAAFPKERIEQLKLNRYFRREYLLQPMSTQDGKVKRVGYYVTLPELERLAVGVDLAISKKQTADFTSINVAGQAEDMKIYNIKNEYGRWNFNEAIENIKRVYDQYVQLYPDKVVMLGIEDVAYQRAAIEEFHRRFGIMPTPIPQTKDKTARLETFLPYLDNDQILFRREGMDDLIIQLLNWGIEPHDDCVDAAEISWRLLVNSDRAQVQWL